MTKRKLESLYLDWMYNLVSSQTGKRRLSYRLLFDKLYEIPFRYILPMDDNRGLDGIDLRYKFGRENGYSDHQIAETIDNRGCSVLEMIVALAVRCETNIMMNPELGDRTYIWFWEMIDSLGLSGMSDQRFEEDYVESVIDIFLDRKYESDGCGGLFTVPNPPRDLRTMEIWYQMHLYLQSEST